MIKREEQVEIMYKYLLTLRKASNLKVEEISKNIGLSQQGYRNIEKHEAPLSICQYTTIRLMYEYVAQRDNNKTLEALLELLFDKEETKEIKKIRENITSITYEKQPKKEMINKLNHILMSSVVMGVIPLVGPALIASLSGMTAIMAKKQKTNNNETIKPWVKNLFN